MSYTSDMRLDKLDDLAASGNLNAQQMQLNEMKNVLRYIGNFFDFVNEAKIDSYSSKLIADGYGVFEVDKSSNTVINRCAKFPTYSELKSILATNKRQISNDNSDNALASKLELQEYESIKKDFIKMLGEDKLEAFVTWYIKNCYDDSVLEYFGTQFMIFEKPALFDWKDANYKLNDIVEVFNMKNIELKRLKEKNIATKKRLVVSGKKLQN